MSLQKALLSFAALVFVGLSLTACDTLGPLVGGYKNTLESLVGVNVAGTYTIEVKKDSKLLMTQTWVCTTDGTKLTGCHQTGSRTVSPDVVAPKP